MALELLAGPFDVRPVIDRGIVQGTGPEHFVPNGPAILIDGRGVLVNSYNAYRYLVQHDGVAGKLGAGRLGSSACEMTLAYGPRGARGYIEYQTFPLGGRSYWLDPITLAGFRDIDAAAPNGTRTCMLLADHSWLWFTGLRFYRHDGSAWQRVTPDLTLRGSLFLSWSEVYEEIWVCSDQGQAQKFNTKTYALGPVLQTDQTCTGMWYSAKHGIFLSRRYEYVSGTSGPALYRMRVWANTPRPFAITQAIAPAPTAGRVSRVTVRVVGNHDDPCPDEVVQWSVPPGYQLVPLAQSTDEAGYALADLVVPLGASGTAAVTASVRV